MIITLDAKSRSTYGSIIVDAWNHGIEIEKLAGYQLELTTADDTRMENLIKRHPSATILHTELVKEVTNGIDV